MIYLTKCYGNSWGLEIFNISKNRLEHDENMLKCYGEASEVSHLLSPNSKVAHSASLLLYVLLRYYVPLPKKEYHPDLEKL
jgi:hypothetical protein